MNKMPKNGFLNIIIAIIVVVVIAGAGYFVVNKKSPLGADQPSAENTKNQKLETGTTTQEGNVDTAGWKTYRNEKYGFEFKYPPGVSVESGSGAGFYFTLTTAIITAKNSTQKSSIEENIFSIGVTDYFKPDPIQPKYILKSPIDSITFKENCTKPFFGNSSIHAAEMSWGEGGDWSILYNILTNHNVGLGIGVDRFAPELTGEQFKKMKKLLDDKIALEKQILQTFRFIGNISSVDFHCKNWSR